MMLLDLHDASFSAVEPVLHRLDVAGLNPALRLFDLPASARFSRRVTDQRDAVPYL
jgi:hypothetical protein